MRTLERGPSRARIDSVISGDTVIEGVPAQHPEDAYVEDGWRKLDMEETVAPDWYGNKGHAIEVIKVYERGEPLVVVELNAEGLEFLIDVLETRHHDDEFTKSLVYAKRLAMKLLYERAAG